MIDDMLWDLSALQFVD